MNTVKAKFNVQQRGGYEYILEAGTIYDIEISDGTFGGAPYATAYDSEGHKIASCHLSRFEIIEGEQT